jgi:hypothetical protein
MIEILVSESSPKNDRSPKARPNGAATRMASPLGCSALRPACSPSASMRRERKSPLRQQQAYRANARRQPQSPAAGLGRQASNAFAKQAGRCDPHAKAKIRRSDQRHHRQDRLAAAFGARLLLGPCEKEAQASPRLRRGRVKLFGKALFVGQPASSLMRFAWLWLIASEQTRPWPWPNDALGDATRSP